MNLAENKKKFLRELSSEIEKNLDKDQSEQIRDFAEQYYETFPLQDLAGREVNNVYASVQDSWQFLQQYDGNKPKVKVFNPASEENGWESDKTIIAILSSNMPFVLDSLRIELNRRNVSIHTIHHAVFKLKRDQQHRLTELKSIRNRPIINGFSEETLSYFEITRRGDPKDLESLALSLEEILQDVKVVVDDFQSMRNEMQGLIGRVTDESNSLSKDIVEESKALLSWLVNDNFTFLGFEAFDVSNDSGAVQVKRIESCGLGLQRNGSSLSDLELRNELLSCEKDDLLQCQITFSKYSVRSRVHRSAYPDCVAVKTYNDGGEVKRVYRFYGLFTSMAYMTRVASIPVVRQKVADVMSRSGVAEGSHDAKELLRVIETFPRDELFFSSLSHLCETVMAVQDIQERRQVRLFIRNDVNHRFFTCMLYAPKDIYSTDFRERVQAILMNALGATESEFTTFFSESVLTRTYFVMKSRSDKDVEFDALALQDSIIEVSKSWQDRLHEALVLTHGEEGGSELARQYANAFSPAYQDFFDCADALKDIAKINKIRGPGDIGMSFYRAPEEGREMLRFRIFHPGEQLILSDMLPILENLGLKVVGDHPFCIRRSDEVPVWMYEYNLIYALSSDIDLSIVGEQFQDAFLAIWSGQAESDGFNRLILGTKLDWREIAMLRAFSQYMKQIAFGFGGEYIAETLGNHLEIAELIVALFHTSFDPDLFTNAAQRDEEQARIEKDILDSLENVANLNEDRIIREYLILMKATLRTNFYQADAAGNSKAYFSFKFKPDLIPDMPLPRPAFEIFVYSPRVEGVHLRAGKVARGGLRWSDRQEDFRTEVLGLVKAQNVKNSVIVPVGAKGGFVAKKLHEVSGREAMQEEGIACYKTFIRGILDITDNLLETGVMPPKDVLRKDADDYYLVVAADKGTATFSDIANAIAADYNFWLGDAFASGGSIGYDHKAMGITARGAWVSVERHFRELGVNTREEEFTVVGVGDMSGDVFGNGMLLSRHIRLVAAFNHLHIFIDPNPQAGASFDERKRLFELPRSGWDDFNKSLISAGGGIFLRAAKSIAISAEMKARFAITQDRLAPNELISALLRSPVDLFWNGGIGTYAKSSTENHVDVGDKANDLLRINGDELGCKVIGEGGNLGFTQMSRVEFGLRGGAANTDFIDNAAGVDCSDHEVNIKILLNNVKSRGDMTEAQRVELLQEMTESVSQLVLRNNYRQVQTISMAEFQALLRLGEYQRLIDSLESSGRLDRGLEFIPDNETLTQRRVEGKALTRPELSVLTSYVKGQLKEMLAESDIPDDDYLAQAIETAFPQRLVTDFRDDVYQHRLRREIIATQIANDLVNHMGITYITRMRQSTGEEEAAITRAYVVSRDVFDMESKWLEIEALDYKISAQVQMRLMLAVRRMVRRGSRWFLRNRRSTIEPAKEIQRFKSGITAVAENLSEMLPGHLCEEWQSVKADLVAQGIPERLAGDIAGTSSLYSGLGIVDVAQEAGADVMLVSRVYFALGEALELPWFAQQINDLPIENHWQALARESFREDIEWQQRALTEAVLHHVEKTGNMSDGLDQWMQNHEALVQRWRLMLQELRATQGNEFAMYSVAIRELLDLAQSSKMCPD